MTSDDKVLMAARELARERLFAAEVAAALAVPLREISIDEAQAKAATWQRWLVAALMLLGIGGAFGVWWLHTNDVRQAQEPDAFDPLVPWYEKQEGDLPTTSRLHDVQTLADLTALPADADTLSLPFRRELLVAIAQRPGVRALRLELRGASAQDVGDATLWRTIGGMQELRAAHLMLGAPRPELVRELRLAGKLRTLTIAGPAPGVVVLDVELARALAELPQLRTLFLSRVTLPTDGLRTLNTLPLLGTLYVEWSSLDEDTFAALASLRGLHALYLDVLEQRQTLTSPELRQLAKMPNLTELSLQAFDCDDRTLRDLPPRLQSLGLAGIRGLTDDGLRQLGAMPSLRALSWAGGTDDAMIAALADVVREASLERFDWPGPGLPASLWTALQQAPRLRALRLRSSNLPTTITEACKLTALERLTIFGARPRVDDLLPLRELPSLRHLGLWIDGGTDDTTAAAIRTALGPRITVTSY